MKDVAFCYPSRVAGGAEFLFVKCAKYLASTNHYRISYIDYDDGFGYKLLSKETGIEHVSYSKGKKVNLKDNTIVITPLSELPLLEQHFESPQAVKYLIWSINPYNLVSYINLHRHIFFTINEKRRARIGERLKELSEKGVIRYMDYNNYYWSSSVFKFSLSEKYYLPISVDDFTIPEILSHTVRERNLSFLWLGRLDVDKYNTVLTLINELDAISDKYDIKLYIVGTGNKEGVIKNRCKKSNIAVEFVGKLFGDELKNLIVNKIDIGYAMGTSALDIAKLRKPTIVEGVLDYPYKAKELKDFVLLSEIENYDVVSPGYYKKDSNRCFGELVDQILNNYDECALSCAKYVYNNHTMTSVGKLLEDAIEKVDIVSTNDYFDMIKYVSDEINSKGVDSHFIYKVIRRILYF